jgi:hypothetical protein
LLEIGGARYQRAATLFALGSMALGPWLLTKWLSPLALVLGSIAGLSLIAAGLWHIGWWGQRRWRRAVWHSDGRWTLTDRAGREFTAFASRDTRVTRHFVRLSWSSDRRSLLLAPQDVPAVVWRRLSARLQLQRDWAQAEAAHRFPETAWR